MTRCTRGLGRRHYPPQQPADVPPAPVVACSACGVRLIRVDTRRGTAYVEDTGQTTLGLVGQTELGL